MSRLVSSTYMVAQAIDAHSLALDVDKATKAGFKLQGGVSVCERHDPITGNLIMWYAQALVREFWVSDNGE